MGEVGEVLTGVKVLLQLLRVGFVHSAQGGLSSTQFAPSGIGAAGGRVGWGKVLKGIFRCSREKPVKENP